LLAAIFIHGVSVPNFRESKITILAILCLVLGTILLSIPNNLFGQLTVWGEFSRANGLMTRIPLFILLLIYAIYSSEKATDRFFKWMMALLIIEVIYGIVQLTGIDPVPWVNPYNNIFVTTGNPNFAAALFAVLVVLTFRFLLMENSFRVRLLSVTCIISGSFMSWSTKSIQGVLTISAAIFLVLLIFFLRKYHQLKARVFVGTSLLLLSIPVISGLLNVGPLKSFLFQETLAIRMHYWRVALSMVRDHPFFGVGIDRYGDYFRYYRGAAFVEKYTPGVISTNAHNVALQWGADLGIMGIAFYLAMFFVATTLYLKNANFIKQKRLTDIDYLYVAFFAFYLQSLISIAQLSITILGFAILGQFISITKRNQISKTDSSLKTSIRSWSNKTSFIGLGTWWLVLLTVLLPMTSHFVRSDYNLRAAMQLPGMSQGTQDLTIRSSAISEAIQPLIEDQQYVSPAIQNLFSQGDAKVGVEIAKQSIQTNPRSWVGLQSQALAYAQSNSFADSIVFTKRALELDPENYNLKANLADLYLKSGMKSEARATAENVRKIAPINTDAYKLVETVLKQVDR
jgi:O-antigen ligase